MNRLGRALWRQSQELPVPLRFAVIGAVALALVGGLVGLIVGLRSYAPTAWAATFEVAVPAALVGGLLGLVVGGVAVVGHRLRAR